jgi:hypothetical protein
MALSPLFDHILHVLDEMPQRRRLTNFLTVELPYLTCVAASLLF